MISFLAALIYMINPWVRLRISQFFLLYGGYAFTPLVFVLYMRLLENKTNSYKKHTISVAFLLCLASITPHYVVFVGIIFLLYLLYESLFDLRTVDYPKVIRNVKSSGLVLMAYFFFSAIWIIPTLQYFVKSCFAAEGADKTDTIQSLPSFPHLGFVNLGALITPQIEAMEVIRA